MRSAQIDALRAVACLLVVFHHLHWQRIDLLCRVGWVGVDLFFVISGFLISRLLFLEFKSSGALNVRRFLLRRALKLYPAYMFLLAASMLLGGPVYRSPSVVLPDLLFFANYRAGMWGHLWSLSIEEHFYLLMPLCLWLAIRTKSLRRVPLAWAIIASTCLALRIWPHVAGRPISFLPDFTASQNRFDGLAFGVLVAYLWEFQPHVIERFMANRGWRALVVFTVATLPVLYAGDDTSLLIHTVGLSLLPFGFSALLVYVLKFVPECTLVRSLASIGAYSYTIYLFHLPLCFMTLDLGKTWHLPVLATYLIYIAGALTAGMIVAKLIEIPILRLREHIAPRPSRLTDWNCRFHVTNVES